MSALPALPAAAAGHGRFLEQYGELQVSGEFWLAGITFCTLQIFIEVQKRPHFFGYFQRPAGQDHSSQHGLLLTPLSDVAGSL